MKDLVCAFGEHPIEKDQEYYVVNPEGGYGLGEVLCCDACIRKPENNHIRQRMIECARCEELL